MQSVFKFPQALAVLSAADQGTISTDRKIHIDKTDLKENTWSPLREKFPQGNVDVTVADLLMYSVSMSDNNACDILFRVTGGTEAVNNYIKSLPVNEIEIVATESEMASDWELQFKNSSTPKAMTELLAGFFNKRYLSGNSTDFLMKLMTESSNSPNRIKALLPEGTAVAHKTGTSGTDKKGVRPALNDVGIIMLPDGKHLAISVFVANSTEKTETAEKIIAGIAKLAWDYYD